MLGICGVVFIVIGGITLAGSSTMFGQIAGLILWVIAALFIVGQAIIGALAREARSLGQALAMHAEATNKPASAIRIAPRPPAQPIQKESWWKRFLNS